jgi:ribonucleoside-diphosphate reductase alpha chain
MAFEWLNDKSRQFLQGGYILEGQTPEGRIREIAEVAEKHLSIPGYADKFYDYMGRGFYSLASPVWSNYGLERGLPVSCFGSYIDDHMESILYNVAENGMLMKSGGGTSAYFGALRPRGAPIKDNGTSTGSVSFMRLFETLVDVVSQGNVRRGMIATYLPIDHPDALDFLDIGTEGNPIQDLKYAVCVSDEFIEKVKAGDSQSRKLWAKVLQRRVELGYPYIHFTGNANKNKPEVYKDHNLEIYASNLCNEIQLPSSIDETFTCVLSSLNLLHWDEIKETDAIETLIYFLDTVAQEFIDKTEGSEYYSRANRFAKRHRALGAGLLGWHSLLQSKLIPFESREAAKLNLEIAKTFKERTYKASAELAEKFGEPELLKGYGRRNTTLMAIAPTKSSSFILGQVSEGIEPNWRNVYVKDLAKIKVTVRNEYLEAVLEKHGKNTDEVWQSIKDQDGSVQHLEFLSDLERDVFKTFAEINPEAIIYQAATRQEYVDQGQSLNLVIPASTEVKEINRLYLMAHELGIKGLYYQKGTSAAQELSRKKTMAQGCVSCEG